MPAGKFRLFNLIGGVTWVTIALMSGFFFGNISFVKNHIELIMLAIVIVSLIPVLVTFVIQHKKEGSPDEE